METTYEIAQLDGWWYVVDSTGAFMDKRWASYMGAENYAEGIIDHLEKIQEG